jgi:indole-3-glycerol phosphate synthase
VTDLDEYQVEVAAGVDAAAVLAVAVVIDEDHDGTVLV